MTLNMRWSLERLYDSFAGKSFQDDLAQYGEWVEALNRWGAENLHEGSGADPVTVIRQYVDRSRELTRLGTRLSAYAQLVQSVEMGNEEAKRYMEVVEKKGAEMAGVTTGFAAWLSQIGALDGVIAKDPVLQEHAFYLQEIQEANRYRLSEKEELAVARLKSTGSSAWGQLRDALTANLMIDVVLDGKEEQLPFTVIRNMAYDKDGTKRKSAYEAELKAYEKIDQAVAACLNGIKGEVITLAGMRGYASPLEQSVIEARMDRKMLDVLLEAIRESLPVFQQYLKQKARLLGHPGGLPFYDLFAPVGELRREFTYEEAQGYIEELFSAYSEDLGQLARTAFNEGWVDAEPRQGKVGGAFCYNLQPIKESRICSNFSNNLDSVITLAHELGHAYHGRCLSGESILNSHYTMPIAETASTFCEMLVKDAALGQADGSEKLFILDKDLGGATQVIVDIYSRFLFEDRLFAKRQEGPLSVDELKTIMTEAQKEAYGTSLDQEKMHPYAWLAKPHYYDGDCNYYNFPYAFGLLFARGLYAQYQKDKATFIPAYAGLLGATGKNSLADVARIAGIDLYDINFWRQSLQAIGEDAAEFSRLAEKK